MIDAAAVALQIGIDGVAGGRGCQRQDGFLRTQGARLHSAAVQGLDFHGDIRYHRPGKGQLNLVQVIAIDPAGGLPWGKRLKNVRGDLPV